MTIQWTMSGPVSASAVVRSLRRLRDRYFPGISAVSPALQTDHEEAPPGCLESLPVDVQFLLMTYLCPADLCRLGATCRYWRGLVRDALLWRFFLLRDMPHWDSIDHLSMPQLDVLDGPLIDEHESLDDREEGVGVPAKVDYMAEYLRGSPSCRQRWLPQSPTHNRVFRSFLQSLVASTEPRYAMFGPGMEQLDVSFVTRLMHAPDVLPMSESGAPHRQINGIGSGISYLFNNQQKLNILTLYSANRADRERARTQQLSVNNRLFTVGSDKSGVPVYRPAAHVLQVCQLVDGFIYVADAEHDDQNFEAAQIQAVLDSSWGSTSRPLLVLSCVSREGLKRVPCVFIAKRLELTKVPNPWMVQDVVIDSLSGVLDGISWLLHGVKLQNR